MPFVPVIGISGKARVGKDTAAQFLIAHTGGYRYSFADPIRRMLAAGLGIDMGDPYWQANKEEVIPALGRSPRYLMQTLGTEWGRDLIAQDLWVILAKQTLLRLGPGMVIPDVRFETEAAWIRSIGGRILHLTRPNASPVEAHSSEAGIITDGNDIQVVNSGSLEELQAKIKELFGGRDQTGIGFS